MINLATMTYTRRSIVSAIDVLSAEQQPITYEQIAKQAGCSAETVKRAMPQLLADNKIRRRGKGKKGSFTYEVVW